MIPGLGRSPGEGKGYPLQYSDLENSMDCMYSLWGHKEMDTTEQLSLHLGLKGEENVPTGMESYNSHHSGGVF